MNMLQLTNLEVHQYVEIGCDILEEAQNLRDLETMPHKNQLSQL